MNRAAALALVTLLAFAAPPAQAQSTEALYEFAMTPLGPTAAGIIPGGTAVSLTMLFQDQSRDSSGGVLQNPAVPNVSPYSHQIFFDFVLEAPSTVGWAVQTPSILYTQGGGSYEVTFDVSASLLIQEPVMPITFIARTNQGGQAFQVNVTATIFSLGALSFNAQAEDLGGEIKPDRIVDIPVRITNGALVPRGFDIEVTSNPCNLQVATSSNNLIAPKVTKVVTVSTRTPNDKVWYFSQICELGLNVAPSDTTSTGKSITASIIINGGYFDPQWAIWGMEILLVVLLIVWLVVRRKARIEEEILGKPQKPWTIPVEALYLKALREKDERAWYVVRHHLMEEEYRSALLWYHAYKARTKGARQQEALVIRQEKAYERWRKQWEREIAKPLLEADRFEAKLQRKLDRKAAKADRKQLGKYTVVRSKMQKAHAAQLERAMATWEKQAQKAAKKGQPAPPRPKVPEPDYPKEPQPTSIALADHRWGRRAERFRARMVRKQGDLEVKFEKADARRLVRVRRAVHRVARKLDDPQFIEEHPLLKDDKPAGASTKAKKA